MRKIIYTLGREGAINSLSTEGSVRVQGDNTVVKG